MENNNERNGIDNWEAIWIELSPSLPLSAPIQFEAGKCLRNANREGSKPHSKAQHSEAREKNKLVKQGKNTNIARKQMCVNVREQSCVQLWQNITILMTQQSD